MLKSIFLKKTFRTWQRENIVKIHFTSITGSRGITNFLGSISTFHSVELVPALLFAKAQYLPICLGPQFRNWSIQRRPCSSRSGKKIYISKRCTTYATWTRTAKTIARFHLILMPWWCFQVVGILCTKSYIVHLLEISMNWNHWPFVHFISWYPWIVIW